MCLCVSVLGNGLARLITFQPACQPLTVWQSLTFQATIAAEEPRDRGRKSKERQASRVRNKHTSHVGLIHSSLVSPIWDFSLTAALYSHLYKMQFMTLEPSRALEEHFEK